MITYLETWKTVLILSHGIDTCRTLFLVPIEVSLRSEPSSWANFFKNSRSRIRLLSSASVKDTGWSSSSGLCASSLASTVKSLCWESELYSMLPSCSGTGTSGSWVIGLMAEEALGYLKWYLFLRFISFRFIGQKWQSVMWYFPSLWTFKMTNGILFILPFL